MAQKYIVSSSPHIHAPDTTKSIMLDVIIALLPATVFGCLLFSYQAVLVVLTSVISCVLFEFISRKIMKRENTIGDLSAVVTGILLALNLPSTIPLWMVVIGAFAAIVVVKQMFGGLGNNFVNPAIAARIILLISFPAAMTTFYAPFETVTADTLTSATPLVAEAEVPLSDLFFGINGGCIGETSVAFLLLGGIYLVIRRVISPIIPLSFIGSVALITLIISGNPMEAAYAVCSGGVVLGAVFMATDYVTSPTTPLGKLIFGIGCGAITVLIRSGSAAEGVSFAIILMNILTPQIERITLYKPFGWEGKKNG